MTNYTPKDIFNFIKDNLKDNTDIISIKINPQNSPLSLQAGAAAILNAHDSITIKFKKSNNSNFFLFIHDLLKNHLKGNEELFSLLPGSENTLHILLL